MIVELFVFSSWLSRSSPSWEMSRFSSGTFGKSECLFLVLCFAAIFLTRRWYLFSQRWPLCLVGAPYLWMCFKPELVSPKEKSQTLSNWSRQWTEHMITQITFAVAKSHCQSMSVSWLTQLSRLWNPGQNLWWHWSHTNETKWQWPQFVLHLRQVLRQVRIASASVTSASADVWNTSRAVRLQLTMLRTMISSVPTARLSRFTEYSLFSVYHFLLCSVISTLSQVSPRCIYFII